jgi:hypothetical protein
MVIKINKDIIKEVFYFLAAILVLFMLAEIVWPNSVLSYLNINYVIVLWVISWLLLL